MLTREVFESKIVAYNGGGHCDTWTINPYRLCDHRCTYCITGAQGKSVPTYDAQRTIEAIGEALEGIPNDRLIMVGGFSDPYPHAEEEHQITREILKFLNGQNRRYNIITKGLLVERDADLIKNNPICKIVLSFSTLDDELAKHVEPFVSPPSARLDLVKRLVAQGIRVAISMSPWIPSVTDIQAFIDNTQPPVQIHTDRLKIVRSSRTFSILGRSYTQREIDELFLKEKKKFAHHKRIHWHFDDSFSQTKEDEQHPVIANLQDKEQAFQAARIMANQIPEPAPVNTNPMDTDSFMKIRETFARLRRS